MSDVAARHPAPRRRSVTVNGRLLSYQEAGPADGPVVLLLHGLLSESTTWQRAVTELADRQLHVIALDLLGHGESDKPELEYTLEDFATNISAFLAHPRLAHLGPVTLAGHSLGGAIAMQFARFHSTQIGRLVLISSGGLGRQVHLILRVATLPGTSRFLRVTVNRRTARFYARPELHRLLRLPPESVVNLTRIGQTLMSDSGRAAFVAAARSAITPSGQLGDMIEHSFVAPDLPTLIVWSEHDPIIPVSHAHEAHRRLPSSRLELFPGSSHEPHRREPVRFADAVARFIAETEPMRR